jgi:ABC-type Fe3+-siderophore transport system permease subunit
MRILAIVAALRCARWLRSLARDSIYAQRLGMKPQT